MIKSQFKIIIISSYWGHQTCIIQYYTRISSNKNIKRKSFTLEGLYVAFVSFYKKQMNEMLFVHKQGRSNLLVYRKEKTFSIGYFQTKYVKNVTKNSNTENLNNDLLPYQYI